MPPIKELINPCFSAFLTLVSQRYRSQGCLPGFLVHFFSDCCFFTFFCCKFYPICRQTRFILLVFSSSLFTRGSECSQPGLALIERLCKSGVKAPHYDPCILSRSQCTSNQRAILKSNTNTQLQIQMLYKSITSCFPYDIRVLGFNFHQIQSCIANCIDFISFDIFPRVKMSNAKAKSPKHHKDRQSPKRTAEERPRYL